MAANRNWIANQTRRAQTHTLTIAGTPAAGDTVYLTVNGKTVTYTVITGDTVTTVASGLLSMIRQSPEGEFQQFNGNGTGYTAGVITLVATNAGRPTTATGSGTLSVGATGTTTITCASVYTNLTPADASDTANWQGGTAPTSTDSVYFKTGPFPMLYNLSSFSALSLAAIYVYPTFTGNGIGLPPYAPEGYLEYRGGRLAVTACPILRLELPNGATPFSYRFNTGSTAATVFISGDGKPGIGNEPVDWVGSSGSSTVECLNSGISIGTLFGDSAQVSSVQAIGSSISIGSGVTINTLTIDSSDADVRCDVSVLNMDNGATCTVHESAALTTVSIQNGRLIHISSGDITTLTIGSGGVADFSQGRDAITITNIDVNEGGTLLDPYKRCTFTNGIGVPNTGGQLQGNITIDLGTNYRIQRSAY